MKIRYVLLLLVTFIVVAFVGLVFLGHKSSQTIEKTAVHESSDDSSIIDKTYQSTSISSSLVDDNTEQTSTTTDDSVLISQKSSDEDDTTGNSDNQSSAISFVDDGYNYVLDFADGTRRLANAAPTGKYWQQGTSSAGYGNHLGRTDYNQIKPDSSDEIKAFEEDTQEKMNSSKPFSN